MKRTWKNFRLDKNKCKKFLGQAILYSGLYIGAIVFEAWAFLQNTIY